MISIESLNAKIQSLPISSQEEVVEFVDDLIAGSSTNGHTKKAVAWELWANSHDNTALIYDDSREVIYED